MRVVRLVRFVFEWVLIIVLKIWLMRIEFSSFVIEVLRIVNVLVRLVLCVVF